MFIILIALIALIAVGHYYKNLPTVAFVGILLVGFVVFDRSTRLFIEAALGFIIGGRKKMK